MSQWDKNLKEGDLILAYHAGIHRVTKIEQRFYTKDDIFVHRGEQKAGAEYSSLIFYLTVMNSSGKKVNNRINSCDAQFCTKLTAGYVAEHRKKEIDAIKKYDAMEKLL